MQLRNEHHTFTGMQRDTSPLRQPSSFLYNAKNIRLTPRGDDTMYAITNEKGTVPTSIVLTGTYLGHCLLNEFLVIFTHGTDNKPDYIYRVNLDTEVCTTLYNGSLSFSTEHPIKAIGSYENVNIQKVYWTDGYNQPRIINIAPDKDPKIDSYNDNSFEFIPVLTLNENVRVTKIIGSGEFPPGVIQYAFTYFNKYGQESNIFYTTPLQYISYLGRGGSPESKVANAFRISLSGLDLYNFEYLRIYSILRTSLNGTPVVKRLQDIKLLQDRNIGPPVITNYMWYFTRYGASKEVKISTNGGLSFRSPSSYAIDPSTDEPLDGTRDGYINWTSAIVNGTNAAAYKFTKSALPNLIVKVGNYYYSWYEGTTTMYVGVSDTYSGYNVVVGQDEHVSTSNICQSDGIYRENNVGVTFIDDGTQGDIIDPTELLYKGGETIKAEAIAQKDNTLFFGGISLDRERPDIKSSLLIYMGVDSSNPIANSNLTAVLKNRPYLLDSTGSFAHIDTLSGPETEDYLGASAFKSYEYYRLGIQFQHKSGKWSEPFWVGDKQCTVTPTFDTVGNNENFFTKGIGVIATPGFSLTLNNSSILNELQSKGYKRARPVFVYPTVKDRTILCQGVACPTMYRKVDRWSDAHDSGNGVWTGSTIGTVYAQSSWLFRTMYTPQTGGSFTRDNGGGVVSFTSRIQSQYDNETFSRTYGTAVSPYLRSTEIMGKYDDGHAFYSDGTFITIHTPDVVFDDALSNIDFTGCKVYRIGTVHLDKTYGDIELQTSSPAIGSDAAGFVHKSIRTEGYAALITGLFYNDYVVDDTNDTPSYGPYHTSSPPVDWPVYMWHKNGSINNDVARSGRTAELLKKKISNYRQGGTTTFYSATQLSTEDIKLFDSDQLSMIKVGGKPYRGNIETMLTPTEPSAYYLVGNPWRSVGEDITDFTSDSYYKLCLKDPYNTDSHAGIWTLQQGSDDESDYWVWKWDNGLANDVGNNVRGLCQWREGISMKYKSTPHLVASLGENATLEESGILSMVEVRKQYDKNTIFGGTTDDAMTTANWIPCGPVVNLNGTNAIQLEYLWGDSYYQQFECLKTYAFTPEDKNQVVEIASFMVESRVNIDGRYDRNRGQVSNLNMSPQNFNLINPVYSQPDNFFNYRILEDDYYKVNGFPNQVTWSKEKQAGSETDIWTNVTLASTYDMDGSKGAIKSLNVWKGTIYCFQDKGISNILFNSRVQIPTSDNVPIEISNSYKVDGYRYISDGIGCSSSQLITDTPSGIYFIDSIGGHMFHIGDGISDISATHNMTTWFDSSTGSIKDILYDDTHHDVYIVNDNEALCFSEILGQFTSFFDYGAISLIGTYKNHVFTLKGHRLFKMFEGEYNDFFGVNATVEGETQYVPDYKPWNFTFISNGVDNSFMDFDKIFTNIDYRMDVSSGNNYQHDKSLDVIRVSTEYQDTGNVTLKRYQQSSGLTSMYPSGKNLEKKFRIWRIQIPRNQNSMDRIRNPWCKITLGNNALNSNKAVLHDLNVQYYM